MYAIRSYYEEAELGRFLPFPGKDGLVIGDQPGGESQQKREHVLGNGSGAVSLAIAHRHPELTRGLHIDNIGTRVV